MTGPCETGTVRTPKSRAEAISPDVRRLREGEGLSLGAIARRLHASKATVGKAAELAGVRFDAASTAELTEAHLAGSRLRRAKLAETLLAAAEDRASRIAGSSAKDGRDYAVTAGVLVDKVLVLERSEREDHKTGETAEKMDDLFGPF
jgi:hypothetical protein